MKSIFRILLVWLFFCCLGIFPLASQSAEVVGTVTNPDIKMNGVAWDGKNILVVTYQSSPIEWRIAKLDDDGTIIDSFVVPVDSLDDIHNFGMSNITSNGRRIYANHWNEGYVYEFTNKGRIIKKIGVDSVNQLIPVGVALEGRYIWVFHWSNKKLYKIDRNGKELDSISVRKLTPPPDMGLAWDGSHFWVASKGANRIHRIKPDGEKTGMIKGPKDGGGIRDIAWDGEHLLVVYRQDNTVYKLKISD